MYPLFQSSVMFPSGALLVVLLVRVRMLLPVRVPMVWMMRMSAPVSVQVHMRLDRNNEARHHIALMFHSPRGQHNGHKV